MIYSFHPSVSDISYGKDVSMLNTEKNKQIYYTVSRTFGILVYINFVNGVKWSVSDALDHLVSFVLSESQFASDEFARVICTF